MKKLTAKRKLEIIKKMSKNYRTTCISSDIIKKQERKIQCRETPDGSEKRILTLRIQTNSDSPVYEDYWGDSYIERIDENAYDDTLNKVNSNEAIVFSFADHDMKMKSVISSTNRKNTKFYKDEDNNYIYEMELDPSNLKHKQIITMMENDELKANSFIFLPEVIEVEEPEIGADYDYIVIQKKGELLSIDAVIYPFYPQNNITMKGAFMTEAQKKEAARKAEEAKLAEEKRIADEAEAKAKAEAEKKAQEDKEAEETKLTEEKRIADEAEETKLTEEKRIADEAEAKAKAEAEKKAQEDKEAELDKSSKFKSLSIAEQRTYLNNKNLNARQIIDKIDTKEKEEEAIKREKIAKKILKSKGENMLEDKIKARGELLTKLTERGFGSIASDKKSFEDVKEDIKIALSERNAEYLDKLNITDDELKLFGLTRSGLTGATAQTGAAIIPVSTDPNVVGQIGVLLPEFGGASRMPMSGLEEKKVAVDVDTLGVAAVKEEGEEAVEDTSTVIKVQFTPKRYPLTFDYNPLLAEHATVVSQKTTNLQNSIKRSWIKGYYDSLLVHKGVTFTSLAATNAYLGGVTSDAKAAEVITGTGATQETFDNLLLSFEARYGAVDEGVLKAEMKPVTWLNIKKDARANGNSALIRIVKGKTMYGNVEIIVRNEYPDDDVTVGNVPIVLSAKANTKIYGGIIVLRDSIEVAFTKEMSTRLITGRGEAKLCDPHYTTFTAVVVATA